MSKTGSIKLLNNRSSTTPGVSLSRQTSSAATSGASFEASKANETLITNITNLMNTIKLGLSIYIPYLKGDLEALSSNINDSIIQSLTNSLFLLKQPKLVSTVYEQYRLFAISLIPIFKNIILQIASYKNLQNQLDDALAKAKILDNMTLLQEYVNSLKSNFNLIPDQTISVPKALIKEPYKTYIDLFGFPEKMAWDSERLMYVTELLKNK
jgi:hypothetical protein